MCGIVGYVGPRNAQNLIYQGLQRLEYRGYDSAGIAAMQEKNGSLVTRVIKAPGKLKELKKDWESINFSSKQAIGHTRWATHGEANQKNAHPHQAGTITLVHNGIIENHQTIRAELVAEGISFQSETDSELFSHLVAKERKTGKTLLESVRFSFLRLKGASAFVVMDETVPDTIVVVRNGSPLVLGLGEEENFVASDVPAVLESTRKIYYLEDNELAEITSKGIKVFSLEGKEKKIDIVTIDWSLDTIDKMGYEHYMLKEIFEQPRAITDTVSSWLDKAHGCFRLTAASTSKKSQQEVRKLSHEEITDIFCKATNVHVIACGTAWHAGLYGQMLLEKIARIPTRTELASEFRYREPVLRSTDVGLVVSQSGETADTLAAVKLMKTNGMKVFAICNVRDSSIARECDAVFYTNAGIEVGVASTKAFTTQLTMFVILSAAIACANGKMNTEQEKLWVETISHLPQIAKDCLDQAIAIEKIAKKYAGKKGFLFLGRGLEYPIALEGALKLKEIAYVHAEGYSAGELKHGPIAMVEPEMLILAIAPEGEGLVHSKSVSNIEEVKARKGTLLGIGSENDTHFKSICADYFAVPFVKVPELLPIIAVMPLQLLAYYIAIERGTEVDQPRNLAKSVTVE